MPRTALLPVDLTDADRLEIQKDLSTVIRALEEVETEKREEMKSYSDAIKGHKKKIRELNDSLISGRIQREVEVEDRTDFIRGVCETFRLDKDPPEVVSTRQIDPDERQVGLGLDGPTVGGAPADTTEEQQAATPEEAEALRDERLAVEHSERVIEQVRAMMETAVIAPRDGAKPEDAFGALVDLGDRVLMEATGESEAAARAALETMLIAYYADAEQEIAKLSREQAIDAAKDGPKTGLKKPKKGPKPRSHKSTADEPAPANGEAKTDGDGLAF